MATVAALAVAGLAFAAWTVDGKGSGSVKAGSGTAIQVSADAPSADLYPGGTGSLKVKLTNPNPFPVTAKTVSYPTPAQNVTSSDEANCPGATNLTFTGTPTTISVPLAPGASSTQRLSNSVKLADTAPNTCQGVTFTINNLIVGAGSGSG